MLLLLLLLLGLSAVPLWLSPDATREKQTTSHLPPRRYFAVRLLDGAELGACAFFADRLPAHYWCHAPGRVTN